MAGAALARPGSDIRLELKPRICTLGIKDQQCEAHVEASWTADQDESLCLVIQQRPDVKKCWEHYAAGTFTIDLVFQDDVTFELRDPALRRVLASEVLRIIKEAQRYRHKRRQPWNVFD
jgi:Leu/Phe-tRNA-protein transferase